MGSATHLTLPPAPESRPPVACVGNTREFQPLNRMNVTQPDERTIGATAVQAPISGGSFGKCDGEATEWVVSRYFSLLRARERSILNVLTVVAMEGSRRRCRTAAEGPYALPPHALQRARSPAGALTFLAATPHPVLFARSFPFCPPCVLTTSSQLRGSRRSRRWLCERHDVCLTFASSNPDIQRQEFTLPHGFRKPTRSSSGLFLARPRAGLIPLITFLNKRSSNGPIHDLSAHRAHPGIA